MAYDLKLFTGNANRPLAEEIAQYLHVPLGSAEVSRFSDGEVFVQITENVRGADVFVIQPTCPPVNDTLMELLVMTDAFKRSSARRITAVLPYYGYARQDRKVQPRVPISAKLVADLMEAAGIARLLTLDLHAGQIQGFFDIPVDHLFAAPVIIDYLGKKDLRDPVIVAPDAGGRGARASHRQAAQRGSGHHRQAPRRPERGRLHAPHRRGEGQGRGGHRRHDRHGGHPRPSRERARARGGPPHPRLRRSSRAVRTGHRSHQGLCLEEVVVTNTIPVADDKREARVTVLSVAPLLGEAIRRIHDEESVSTLFVLTYMGGSGRPPSPLGARGTPAKPSAPLKGDRGMEMQELSIHHREKTGKQAAKRLRRAGVVPAVSTEAPRRRRSASIRAPSSESSTGMRAPRSWST